LVVFEDDAYVIGDFLDLFKVITIVIILIIIVMVLLMSSWVSLMLKVP
jgi:hypothetical protein